MKLPATMVPAPYNVMPRRKTSKFSTSKYTTSSTLEERRAAGQAKAEALVEAVPADILDAIEAFCQKAVEPAVRAGRHDVLHWLRTYHRRLDRGTEA